MHQPAKQGKIQVITYCQLLFMSTPARGAASRPLFFNDLSGIVNRSAVFWIQFIDFKFIFPYYLNKRV